MEGYVVTDLAVHSRRNCIQFSPAQMEALQNKGVSAQLEVGLHLVKIHAGSWGDRANAAPQHEPLVLLWIYGGRVINQQTNVPVSATWVSLNGYDDTLALEVLEPATLCAVFLDTYVGDNDEALTLSVVRL